VNEYAWDGCWMQPTSAYPGQELIQRIERMWTQIEGMIFVITMTSSSFFAGTNEVDG